MNPGKSRAPSQRRTIIAVVVVALLAVAGWRILGQRTESGGTGSNGTGSNGTELPETTALLEGTVPLPTRFHDDLDEGDWDSERFGDLASKQWKRLGGWLADPGQVAPAELSALADASFQCAAPRPQTLQRVFESSSIRVDRPGRLDDGVDGEGGDRLHAGSEPVDEAVIHRGQAGFVAAMNELREPFANATDVRAHFKLFNVELGTDAIMTRQYVTISGIGPDGPLEENATWVATWVDAAHPRLQSLAVEEYERAHVTAERSLFADCTEAVLQRDMAGDDMLGYGLPHWYVRIQAQFGQSPLGYHGLALGDVNGDGLDDVYLCNPGGLPNQLFVQSADGTLTDRSAGAGVDWMDTTTSALFVDLDNDGDQDLVAGSSPVMVLENDGRGRFEGRMLLPGPAVPTSLAAADVDRDGDLDLYVCYYSNESPLPYHDADNGPHNLLWRNDGDWSYTDVTSDVGLDHNGTRFSFAAAWEDYDNDGDLDLYVANDYGRNNLYRNDDGWFRDVAPEAGVEDISAGMSVSFGDYDHDGWMDLYVSNMFSSAGNRITYQRQFNPGAQGAEREALQRHARGNSLFRGSPGGDFDDVSVPVGVTMGRWAWCSLFLDIDNDSFQDLVIANGNITNEDPGDL